MSLTAIFWLLGDLLNVETLINAQKKRNSLFDPSNLSKVWSKVDGFKEKKSVSSQYLRKNTLFYFLMKPSSSEETFTSRFMTGPTPLGFYSAFYEP